MADQNFVVIARFDDATTEQFTALRQRLCKQAASKWPPHITIAAYETVALDALLAWTEEFCRNHAAFNIMFSSLDLFPPGGAHKKTALLFAAPASSQEFSVFYYAFHEKFDDCCGKLGWLYSAKYGYPVFHATIGAIKLGRLQKAMKLAFRQPIFGQATITALEVYTYPMQLIQRFDLT